MDYLMGRWHPTIGDPSPMGWFTVSAYLVCAIMAFLAARSHFERDRRPFIFWGIVSLLMLLLAINKQLDIQSLFTEIGRQIARHQGWMEQRRTVQFWFIVLFGTISITGFIVFAYRMRDLFKRFRTAFVGLFFLLCFIIVRAAGFHHFDEVLQARFLIMKMNWVFELTGIFIVLAAAIADIRKTCALRVHVER
jgi:hypothetical protein